MAFQTTFHRDADIVIPFTNDNRFGGLFRRWWQFCLQKRSAAKKREIFLHQPALSVGGVLHFRVKNMVNIVAHLGCLFMESQSHGSHCLDCGSLRRINHRNAKSSLNISAITSHSSATHDQNVSPMFSY